MFRKSQTIIDETTISTELDVCLGLLSSVNGRSKAKALNTICKKLAMANESNILKVMLIWPHWYQTLVMDRDRTVRYATRRVHSLLASRVLIHPMNPETKKLSRPWISWCYCALNKKAAPSFVQEAFKIIYPRQNAVLDTYHEELVDILHFNLHSPKQ